MDAITLDAIVEELGARVTGRYLSRPRLAGSTALTFETSSARGHRLWLDAGRGTAGVYWLDRRRARRLAEEDVTGRARRAQLHLKKHLDGVRVLGLERVVGERTLCLKTTGGLLVLRLSGPAPALTLARDGTALASVGDGPEAWPPPGAAPEREWTAIDPEAAERSVAEARGAGRSTRRAVLAACPGLGPAIASTLDGSADSFARVVEGLREPRPTLVAPAEPEAWHDADLAEKGAVVLLPLPLEGFSGTVFHPPGWLAAAELYLEGRLRGRRFDHRRRVLLGTTRRGLKRLGQLEANLQRDLEKLPEEKTQRREAEALLAAGGAIPPGRSSVSVPDPYDPGHALVLEVDPRLSGVQNGERRFEKARRTERARHQIALRLKETRSSLEEERGRETRLMEARDGSELEEVAPDLPARSRKDKESHGGPRHYLTGKGLSILVGRSARENQHLTFQVARPEDLWFHARDVPGSHVVLRDNEGRAGANDLREAAEVAAFYSEAREQGAVDVHATRRKHVRPARGGPGRVFVGHSETLRVKPLDPTGRLRRR